MESLNAHATAEPLAQKSQPEYVGFGVRFVAFLIDSVWALVAATLLAALIIGQPDIDVETISQDPAGTLAQLSGRLLFDLAVVAILVVVFWMARSATPGKMVFSAVIADAKTLGMPSKAQLIVRYLGYYLSMFGFMLGFLWIVFDKRKQGWHDKLAGTVVIKKE
ncbi:MAG: RDD family protein [Gammaproteobacteria bacterium]|nr:RDD family protein [Gammaproteobacteria bacterium]